MFRKVSPSYIEISYVNVIRRGERGQGQASTATVLLTRHTLQTQTITGGCGCLDLRSRTTTVEVPLFCDLQLERNGFELRLLSPETLGCIPGMLHIPGRLHRVLPYDFPCV